MTTFQLPIHFRNYIVKHIYFSKQHWQTIQEILQYYQLQWTPSAELSKICLITNTMKVIDYSLKSMMERNGTCRTQNFLYLIRCTSLMKQRWKIMTICLLMRLKKVIIMVLFGIFLFECGLGDYTFFNYDHISSIYFDLWTNILFLY